MLGSLNILALLALVFSLPFSCFAVRVTNGEMPVISNIMPKFGGTEGGTKLTIEGLNFMQNGLNSYTVVTIGGNKLITYRMNSSFAN